MAEESTTPDLIERMRRGFEAISSGDLDGALRFFTHDAVVDMTRTVGVVVHGRDAFRAFQEDWLAGYDEVAYSAEEIVDAGNGVAFVRVLQTARPKGTVGHVTQREPNVLVSEDGRVVRVIIYPESELDEARAAAERLAQERADG
jgi:ketosteroid isomerase-like protein